ncbi:TPA: hypothetical protein N0F65_008851 [Lagenidium giganteum]|uniref:Uncharacterized protein n=1 Tax=Lagenidium giganteum TaxID=4803 RepID=A0AAV2YPJ4_9STRA|nr:TPA: hypothetical protein N0F65_008851 [Lagenidium giganteum]
MMRLGARRLASARAFSTAAETKAPEVAKSSGSSFGDRLTSFTVGFALAAGAGLYQLSEDVDASTKEIQASISSLKSELLAENAALNKRIEQLEKRQ